MIWRFGDLKIWKFGYLKIEIADKVSGEIPPCALGCVGAKGVRGMFFLV